MATALADAVLWASGALMGYLVAELVFRHRLRKLYELVRSRHEEQNAEAKQAFARIRFLLKLLEQPDTTDVSAPSDRGPRHRV